MKNMKRTFFAAIGLVAMVGLAIGTTAQAGDNVAATVTIGTVSVNVDTATFDYGTMPYSSTKESFDVMSSTNIGATVGTVPTDLVIKGSAAAAATPWTISVDTPASNVYEHDFGIGTNSSTRPASYTGLVLTNVTFASNVAANGVKYFGLKIHTPTAGDAAQHTATVTLTASWHS
jgi:hypothetical protein